MNSPEHRSKIGQFLSNCKIEFLRAAKLGQALLGAGFLNDQRSGLHRELGEWLVDQMESGKLSITSDYVQGCLEELKKLDGKLEMLDQEIRELKVKSSYRGDGVAP